MEMKIKLRLNDPVEIQKRKVLTRKRKLELMVEHPRCFLCGEKLGSLDDTDFDHPVPLEMGGSNEMLPVHRKPCHQEKTKQDIKNIAKAKRLGKKHRGETKPKKKIPSRPFQKRKDK